MRSAPSITPRSAVRTVQRDTNAPVAPCARATPFPFGISWFDRNVKVPSPLSNAPAPSGMPTMGYGLSPSVASSAVKMARIITPSATGAR
jgi:hypothetical protein